MCLAPSVLKKGAHSPDLASTNAKRRPASFKVKQKLGTKVQQKQYSDAQKETYDDTRRSSSTRKWEPNARTKTYYAALAAVIASQKVKGIRGPNNGEDSWSPEILKQVFQRQQAEVYSILISSPSGLHNLKLEFEEFCTLSNILKAKRLERILSISSFQQGCIGLSFDGTTESVAKAAHTQHLDHVILTQLTKEQHCAT